MMTEWISVKDRFPDKDGRYLCYKVFGTLKNSGLISTHGFAKDLETVDQYDFMDNHCAGFYDYDSEWGYHSVYGITHWMPLPEPPKEDE